MKRRLLFVFFILLGTYIFIAISPVHYLKNNEVIQRYSYVQITGHRGAAGMAPENTLLSVKKALECEVDRVEIDVHLSADNHVVVIHDETVDRTTNGKGRIRDLNYSEIRKLSVLDLNNKPSKERIPTLEEIIDLVNAQSILIIEIKFGANYDSLLVEKVIEEIVRNDAISWCRIQSFQNKVLEDVFNRNTDIELHKLFIAKLPFLPIIIDGSKHITDIDQYDYISEFSCYHLFVNRQMVNFFHAKNKKVNVWTVDKRSKIIGYINLGVDGIITNYPNIKISNK